MQHPNIIDELDEGLIAHDGYRSVQLIFIQLIIAVALYLFAGVAVISILRWQLLGVSFNWRAFGLCGLLMFGPI